MGKDLKECLDVLGIFLHFLVFGLFCVVLFIVSFIFMDIDPIYLFIKLFSLHLSQGGYTSSILLVFRLVFSTSLVYAVCRSISFVTVWGILVLKILNHCIQLSGKKITKISSNRSISFADFHKYLNLYHNLNLIVFGYLGMFTSPIAIAVMSTGLALEIFSVFTIIRLQDLIQVSWPTYCNVIIIAVLVPLVADIQLPEAVRIFDNTEAILRRWKLDMILTVRGNRRYYFKQIASLRPCSIYAGLGNTVFYPLRKSTKTTYYGLMVYYVVNTLISVPEGSVVNNTFGI
jgi:hypothetical protein